MSWYDECPLSYMDFNFILHILIEHFESEREQYKDRLERIIDELRAWIEEGA